MNTAELTAQAHDRNVTELAYFGGFHEADAVRLHREARDAWTQFDRNWTVADYDAAVRASSAAWQAHAATMANQ